MMDEMEQFKQLLEELNALDKKIDDLIEWADRLETSLKKLRDEWSQYDDTHSDIDDIPF